MGWSRVAGGCLAVIAGCSGRVIVVVLWWLQVVGGGVAGSCLSFKVRDGWCQIRVGKGLGFFIGLLQNEVCFLHLFFWAEIEFKGAVYFLRNVWEGVDQIQMRLIELHLLIEVKML